MGRVLGIDYGIARIGLAISDENQRIAMPLKTISGAKSHKIAVQNVQQAIKELPYPVEKIVLGHPLSLSGRPSSMTLLVEEFAELLKTALNIPLVLFDERLSSSHAERSMKEMQMNRKKRAKKVDVVAASLVLQSYLDSQGL